MEERYKTLVPFRAFFEVGVSPSEAAGRRKVVRTVPRLEAMNVPTGSFVMPSGYGLMVRRPDEELARAMLRCPPPPEPTAGSFTPRGAILYRRLMARGGHAGYVRRSDDDRLREMAGIGKLGVMAHSVQSVTETGRMG